MRSGRIEREMAKELIKFSNDKKGFRLLLAVETLLAVWALAATIRALNTGRNSAFLYGVICLLAMCYILGRSARSYRNLVKRERAEAAKKNGEDAE